MAKILFLLAVSLGQEMLAQVNDPNLTRNRDRSALEAGVINVPCEGCGDKLLTVDPSPQLTQLNLDMGEIIKSGRTRGPVVDDGLRKSAGLLELRPSRSGKEIQNMVKFPVGNGTIEIRRKGFLYKTRF